MEITVPSVSVMWNLVKPIRYAKNDMHSNTDTDTEIPIEQCHTDTDTCLSAVFAVTGLSLYSYVEIIPGPKLNARENFFWIQPKPRCQAEMVPYHGAW